jgi:hypothetical protein
MSLEQNNLNSQQKPEKNFRPKKRYSSANSAENYQKFLEFLDMSGNSQEVRRKIMQSAVLDIKNKKLK